MTPPSAADDRGELFHIALASDWAAAQAAGEYRVSTLGRTLDQEGYIHASYPDQVAATFARFYRSLAEPLVLLVIDPGRLGCEVRPEEAAPGGELFPHIYGPIPVGAVVEVSGYPGG